MAFIFGRIGFGNNSCVTVFTLKRFGAWLIKKKKKMLFLFYVGESFFLLLFFFLCSWRKKGIAEWWGLRWINFIFPPFPHRCFCYNILSKKKTAAVRWVKILLRIHRSRWCCCQDGLLWGNFTPIKYTECDVEVLEFGSWKLSQKPFGACTLSFIRGVKNKLIWKVFFIVNGEFRIFGNDVEQMEWIEKKLVS